MPHSNRKNRNPVPSQRRLQVTDNDGWTHVTSGSNVRRVVRTTKAQSAGEQVVQEGEVHSVLGPAEAPTRLTFEDLVMQYKGYKEKWVVSETWQTLKAQLVQRILFHNRVAEHLSQDTGTGVLPTGLVERIVCVGLGSPSGFLRDGWVDRRAVSMYQLAALETIKDTLFSSSSFHPFKLPTSIGTGTGTGSL